MERKPKVFSPPPNFSFDYKTVAHSVLRAPCVSPACQPHERPRLINHFLSPILLLLNSSLH